MKRIAGLAALVIAASLPLVAGPADAQFNWRQLPGAVMDVSARRVQLERRLVDAVAAGRLSSAEAAEFRRELEQVAKSEAEFRASGGTLSLWESLNLTLSLDRISKAMEARMGERQVATGDIDQRQAEIDRLIADAVASGRLTAYEAEDFKSEAARIAAQEAQFRASDGTLDQGEQLQLALDLDRLNRRIEERMSERRIAPPDVDARQAELDKRVAEGVSSGRLTDQEAGQLKKELDRIAQLETALRVSEGKLTTEEALQLALELEKLSHRIESEMNDTEIAWAGIEGRKAEINRRIGDAVATGRLTPRQADELKAELDRISSVEAAFKADGGLSAEESLTLALDLDRLNRSVDRQLADRTVSWSGIDARQEELDRRIAAGLSSGRLTLEEAQELRRDFDRIAAREEEFKASAGLTADESLTLALDLDRLSSRLQKMLHDPTHTWPGVDARQAELAGRLVEGVLSGRLTVGEARQLRGELERFADMETRFTGSDGSLNYQEALMLALELERLSTKVERQLNDRQIAGPGFDAQKAELEKRINEAVASGRLSPEEVAELRKDFDRLRLVESTFRASGGALELEEVLTLAADLQQLNQRLDRVASRRPIAQPDLRARQIELLRSVVDGVAADRLEPRDVEEFKHEFDKLVSLETTMLADGALAAQEQALLARELDRLSNRLDQMKAEGAVDNLDVRQAQLEREINRAVATRKISPRMAAQLRRELAVFTALKTQFQASGGLNRHEKATLSHQLASLKARLQLYISER